MSEYVMSKRGKEHITNDGYIYRCRYIKIKLSTSHVLYKIVKENSDKMKME